MDKAFMVSPLIGAIAIAAKPFSFSNNFLLLLVGDSHKGVQKSWQRKNRGLPRLGIRTSFRDISEELINFDKGKSLCFWPVFRKISSGLSDPERDRLVTHTNNSIDGSEPKPSKVCYEPALSGRYAILGSV